MICICLLKRPNMFTSVCAGEYMYTLYGCACVYDCKCVCVCKWVHLCIYASVDVCVAIEDIIKMQEDKKNQNEPTHNKINHWQQQLNTLLWWRTTHPRLLRWPIQRVDRSPYAPWSAWNRLKSAEALLDILNSHGK